MNIFIVWRQVRITLNIQTKRFHIRTRNTKVKWPWEISNFGTFRSKVIVWRKRPSLSHHTSNERSKQDLTNQIGFSWLIAHVWSNKVSKYQENCKKEENCYFRGIWYLGAHNSWLNYNFEKSLHSALNNHM